MNRTCILIAFFSLSVAAGQTHAALVHEVTGDVEISFDDQSSFQAEMATYYGGTFYQSYSTPPWSVLGNTLTLSPGMANPVGGSGYADGGYINFSLFDIGFVARAGYEITGYQVSFSGTAEQVGAGSLDISGSNGSASFSGNQYTYSSMIALDLLSSPFYGSILLDAPYVEGPDGTADVYGTAYASIDTIRIEAFTRPVPEPESYALMAAGLGALGMNWRRRRQAGSC